MQEIWKPVAGYESFYEVSNQGRVRAMPRLRRGVSRNGTEFVRRMPAKLLAPCLSNSGYYTFGMTRESGEKAVGFLVHRVVAESFIPNPKNLPWVNHIDGDKTNNRPENLEWCTPTENILHALGAGLMPRILGSQRGNAKLNEDVVFVIKKMMLLGFSNKELASIFKVSTAPISYIRTNKAWTHVPW